MKRTRGRKMKKSKKYTYKKRGGRRKHLKPAEIEEIIKQIKVSYPDVVDEMYMKEEIENLRSRLENKDFSEYDYEFNNPENDGTFKGKDARKDTTYRRGLDYATGIWVKGY